MFSWHSIRNCRDIRWSSFVLHNSTQQSPYSSKQEITNFDIVDYDANGDVYITRYEKNITMNDVPLSNLRNLSELILQMREKQV